jgi:hypothetical protein
VHHAEIILINGKSYRHQEAQERADAKAKSCRQRMALSLRGSTQPLTAGKLSMSPINKTLARWEVKTLLKTLGVMISVMIGQTAVAAQPINASAINSERLVFAHYFPFFQLSFKNVPPEEDSYVINLMNPNGDGGKLRGNGGYVRSRPIRSQRVRNEPSWQQANMEDEVRSAISRGIDGFTFNYVPIHAAQGSALRRMIEAAKAVSPAFKIVLMPDMDGFGGTDAKKAAEIHDLVAELAGNSTVYHLADGRLVLMPYRAENQPARWWANMLQRWRDEGISIAFIPLFLNLSSQNIADFQSISYGFADWGKREASATSAEVKNAGLVHQYGKIYVEAVAPQDYRPKSFRYWESSNSTAFRNAWTSSTEGHADWVQIITWSDYSESSQIEPSTNLEDDDQSGFFDLLPYYVKWFKTGRRPTITCDVLYYFHRRERTDAPAPAQDQPTVLGPWAVDKPANEIELLAFLTAPGTLEIGIGNGVYTKKAEAGITSFKVPLSMGRPVFRLIRDGKELIAFASKTRIVKELSDGTLDLTYQSGSKSVGSICSRTGNSQERHAE